VPGGYALFVFARRTFVMLVNVADRESQPTIPSFVQREEARFTRPLPSAFATPNAS